MNTCLPVELLDSCRFKDIYNLDIPKGPEHSSKKVARSKMPKGATCFTVDSGSALSSKKHLFSGKRQGYRMKRKEDATNYFARIIKVQNEKV